MIAPIITERLRLESLTVEFLESISKGDLEGAKQTVSFQIPPSCSLVGAPAIARRLKMIEADPAQHPWMHRAIVRRRDDQMLGSINFHHKAPDPDLAACSYASYGVELGYTIEPGFRRMGYARESILGMMAWAHREHDVRDFFVSISPENTPSMRLAESMAFEKVGEYQDPIDGLEHVMRWRFSKDGLA